LFVPAFQAAGKAVLQENYPALRSSGQSRNWNFDPFVYWRTGMDKTSSFLIFNRHDDLTTKITHTVAFVNGLTVGC